MELAIFILFTAAWAFAAVSGFCYQAHMFQLNSYGAGEHLRWTFDNLGSITPCIVTLIACVPAVIIDFLIGPQSYGILGMAGHCCLIWLLVIAGLSTRPQKNEKTPLVYTARVKRMMITYLVLFTVAGVFAWIYRRAGYIIMLGTYTLSPAVLLAANLINSPAEAAVRRHYLKDALKILASCPSLKVIGITGSYGKTSMKYFLNSILKEKYNVLMTPGNYNTPMGVVKTVRGELRGYHEYFICEMGAKKVGEIKELCDIAKPLHGIVTSVGPQHLESFKSMENIISTKLELANNLYGGKAFINLDNEYLRDNLPVGAVTYGTAEDADYKAFAISVSRKGTSFSVKFPDGTSRDFSTVLIGAHNVVNLCGAIAMAHFLGVEDDAIRAGVSRITPVPHRLQLIEKNGITIIDDAYNSNPSGCRAALDTLSYFDVEYKILVTPGMVELGEKQDELNREFGREAARVCDFVILVGEEQTKPIYGGLCEAGYGAENIFVAESLNTAMDKVYSIVTDKPKAVLLENDLPDNY